MPVSLPTNVENFALQPLLKPTLRDAAGFLHRWRSDEIAATGAVHRAGETAASIERRLHWLLIENPVAVADAPLGYCIRDAGGQIRGLNLCYPAAFRSSGRRLLALGSGAFYVETPARSLGFYLFRKYLSSSGYSFFFATTCNAVSSELWSRLGGCAVPGSDAEYILPLKLDGMIPALVARKTSSPMAAQTARLLARCANPILRLLTRRTAELAIEPCYDWEKLSELSRRHQSGDFITSDRSVEFLQWRYGPSSPHSPCAVYLFRDQRGNEGWFSLANLVRGRQVPLRGSVLLDVIWPREKMSFDVILHKIVRLSSSCADAVILRSQPGFDYRDYCRWVIRHRLPAPRAFVKMPNGAPPLALGLLDYDDNDYGAWRRHWTEANRPPAGPLETAAPLSKKG